MADFDRYSALLKDIENTDDTGPLPQELLIERDRELSVYYAPFDYINNKAQICICGITPGLQQAWLAINEAKRQLTRGESNETALKMAKETASFGGPMRSNLVAMLDCIGVNSVLNIDSCAELFASRADLVHYTSALRYPVLLDGKNYSGTPNMIARALLKKQVEHYLAEEVGVLPSRCFYIPLGPRVSEAFHHLTARGVVSSEVVLHGMPHPSGANAERVSYFLGRKDRDSLSTKTNPRQLDEAKNELLRKVNGLRA